VEVEDLADDLPLAVRLEQGEHVGELVARPVVEFRPRDLVGQREYPLPRTVVAERA
jgi:hypothetical protein